MRRGWRVRKAREEGARALARELHDELGQTLTAIKLELARADRRDAHRSGDDRPAVDRLQSLVGLVEIGIADGQADHDQSAARDARSSGAAAKRSVGRR